MGVGEILGRACSLFWGRLGVFLAIEVLIVAPTLVLELALPEVAIGPFAGLFVLPMLILGPIGSAATLHVIAQEYLGQPVSLGEAFKFALGRFLPLLGTSLLGGLGIAVGLVACCIPGIYLAVIWAFMSQVVVMENVAGDTALGRSKDLVKGYFWQVFGVLFVVAICVGMVNAAVNVPLTAALPFQEVVPGNPGNPMPQMNLTSYLNFAIVHVVTTLVSGIGQTFSAICTTLLYFDLRNRKEAFDVSHIVSWMDQYRDWRDEPVPERAAAHGEGAPETGIKQAGDAVPGHVPPETSIQDRDGPRENPPPINPAS
jgi:hypothetical protein